MGNMHPLVVMHWLRTVSYRLKHFLFRNYWLLAPALIILILIWLVRPGDWSLGLEWKRRLAIAGGVLTSLYLLQKQKLEETQLFNELFQSFNHRYDEMNDCLNRIVDKPEEEVLTEVEQTQLYDYFNLCAEEYLFYQRGYVPQEVWQAWREGMRYYMRNPRIRSLWEEERDKQGSSYYGLQMPEPDGDSSED
jgi:hypothetical protein